MIRLGGATIAAALALAGLWLCGATPAARSPETKWLRLYLVKTGDEVKRQKAAFRLLERVFEQPPDAVQDVPGAFWAASSRLKALAGRWERIRGPRPLRPPHAGMARSLRLTARAFRVLGDGYDRYQVSGDPQDWRQAVDQASPIAAEAGKLRSRWTKALRAALRRARVPIPRWLHQTQ